MEQDQSLSPVEEANQGRFKPNTLYFLDESFNLFTDCNFAETIGRITAKGRTGGNSLVLPG